MKKECITGYRIYRYSIKFTDYWDFYKCIMERDIYFYHPRVDLTDRGIMRILREGGDASKDAKFVRKSITFYREDEYDTDFPDGDYDSPYR